MTSRSFEISAANAEAYYREWREAIAIGIEPPAPIDPPVWRLGKKAWHMELYCQVADRLWTADTLSAAAFIRVFELRNKSVIEEGLHVLKMPSFTIRFDKPAWDVIR